MDGVFRHVEQLARFFIEGGARVDLAYSSERKSEDLDRLIGDLESRGGATLDLEVGNAPGWRDLRALRRLHRFVRERRPLVIHAHSSKAGILARCLRFLGEDAPLLYTPHAYYGSNPSGDRLRSFIFNSVERAAGRFGTSINLNAAEAEFAQKRLGIRRGRLRVIPNGVDPEKFYPATPVEKAGIRRRHGIPEDAILLGTVGRADAQKDPITLYRALIPAMRSNPRLHFFHLGWKGEPEILATVEAMIAEAGLAERIHQQGYSSDPAPAYRMLDGFVMASLYEGMSYVILEALMSGLPLILTEADGNLYLRDYPLSELWWAPLADVPALGQAIGEWAGKAGFGPCPQHRMLAEAHFSNRSSCRRIALSYAQALVGRRIRSLGLTLRNPATRGKRTIRITSRA